MSTSNNAIVIDLTESFTLADHVGMSNAVIDLDTDDSFLNDYVYNMSHTAKTSTSKGTKKSESLLKKSKTKKRKSVSPRKKRVSPSPEKPIEENFGGCPICWDDLGKNPLASTKCGHVYCMKCLEQYLKVEKKCPTCRQSLKGAAAYHPLYLNR